MPYAEIADGRIYYEMLGTGSQCIAYNPGGDNVHTREAGEALAKLLPDAELHPAYTDEERENLVELSNEARMQDLRQRVGERFADFLKHRFPQ